MNWKTMKTLALFSLVAAAPCLAQDAAASLAEIAKKKPATKAARVYTNDDFPAVVEVAAVANVPAGPEAAAQAQKPELAAKDAPPVAPVCSALKELTDSRDRLQRKSKRITDYLERAPGELQKEIYHNALRRLEEELLIAEVEIEDFRETENVSVCQTAEAEPSPTTSASAPGN